MYELTGNGFTTITQDMIRTYIGKAQNMIVYAKPAFYKEEMETLLAVAQRGVSCDVYFDMGDTSIRRGFGEAEALQLIRKQEELPDAFKYHLKKRIRLAFLIVDDLIVLFAPNIRAFEEEEAELDFPNGVVCKGELAKDVVRLFIPELKGDDEPTTTMVINFGSGEEETEQIQTTLTVNKPEDPVETQQALDEAVAILEKNPAVKPEELQRTLIYTDNYKVMRIIRKGIKIDNKRISLRPFYDLIGVTPANARYEWQVLNRADRERLESLKELDANIEAIKREYKKQNRLFEAKDYGTIIDVTVMKEFQKKLETAKDNFIQRYSGENKDVNELQAALDDSADNLRDLLYRHCSTYYEEFKAALAKDERYSGYLANRDRITLFKNFMDGTDYLHQELHFPTRETILENIGIKFTFSDISNEMLNDDEFMDFIEKYELTPRKYMMGFTRRKDIADSGQP